MLPKYYFPVILRGFKMKRLFKAIDYVLTIGAGVFIFCAWANATAVNHNPKHKSELVYQTSYDAQESNKEGKHRVWRCSCKEVWVK